MANDLSGIRILITAGRPREDIDGVRHYANHKRSEGHGFTVAQQLSERGAKVTIICPESFLAPPPCCRVIDKGANGETTSSGHDLMKATRTEQKDKDYDAILCLASIASIKPVARSANKLKVKNAPGAPVTMTVTGNIDVMSEALSWGKPVFGYDCWQETFATPDQPESMKEIHEVVRSLASASWDKTNVSEKYANKIYIETPLSDKKVIITSGPTVETLTITGDVMTNFSSGRQGYEIAKAFATCGAEVVFVSGPSVFDKPSDRHIHNLSVTSAQSMLKACEDNLPADIFVGVAAVADFGRKDQAALRLTETETYDFILDQNPDILSSVGHNETQRPKLVIGFAAETDSSKILDYAHGKLIKKNADMICANVVTRTTACGTDENQIIFITQDNEPLTMPSLSKQQTAEYIVEKIATLLPQPDRHDQSKRTVVIKLERS